MNIEPLESRIAPASAFVTYTDIDGDLVKITATTPAGTPPLDAGDLAFTDGTPDGQLATLTLTDPLFQNASIAFTVTKKPSGDGLAHVGYINATDVDLGAVTVKGDLGAIDSGDADRETTALALLAVQSMGRFDLASQGGAGDLESNIRGPLGGLTVVGDIKDAFINVSAAPKEAAGTIGFVTIGGSLIGASADFSGYIFSTGKMGPVKIGRDVIGGAGISSGAIASFGDIASVTISGSVLGRTGAASGSVSGATFGPVKIGRELAGGDGFRSGSFVAGGTFASLTVGGSVRGGAGQDSGLVEVEAGLGKVMIGGDFIGGSGMNSGRIDVLSSGEVGDVSIAGSMRGGLGSSSGTIHSAVAIGAVKIGRDLAGGDGPSSGRITAGTTLESVTTGGAIVGGMGSNSGHIRSEGDMGPVKVARDVVGGTGANTFNTISSGAAMDAVNVGGSLLHAGLSSTRGMGAVKIGGDVIDGGINAGSMVGDTLASVTVGGAMIGGAIVGNRDLGAVKIGRDVVGGLIGADSGALAGVTIGGSLLGGQASFTGYIFSDSDMGPVKIGGDLRGGSVTGSEPTLDRSGYIEGGRIASVTIGGSIVAGINDSTGGSLVRNASIRAKNDIGPIVIKGSIVGRDDFGLGASPVIISARGEAAPSGADTAIASLTVGGRVERARILGGFDVALTSQNANAEIGKVSAKKDWIASSLTANGKLASVTIGGVVIGSDDAADGFAVQSREILAFKAAGNSLAFTPGPMNDPQVRFSPNSAGDVIVFETGAPIPPAPPIILANLDAPGTQTATYTDIDGDKVTVKVSAGTLTPANFTFSSPATSQQLLSLNLSGGNFDGADITFTVKKVPGGDGLANVGFINATGDDLGKVTVKGDLGQIVAGDPATLADGGLKSLSVRSLGRFGLATQAGGDLASDIAGALGSLKVSEDIKEAAMRVMGSDVDDPLGSIGAVTIGGSIIGGSADGTGLLVSSGKMGPVALAGDLLGGDGASSGRIGADQLVSLRVGGSTLGGTGHTSATIASVDDAGAIQIGRDLAGGLGFASSSIFGSSKLAAITIGGSVLGVGDNTAQIVCNLTMGPVKIGGHLFGGNGGPEAGQIRAFADLVSVTIGGSIIGGSNLENGSVISDDGMGPVTIAGHVLGGGGQRSGSVFVNFTAMPASSVKIGGSVVGGDGPSSALIGSPVTGLAFNGPLGSVAIGGDVIGGAGDSSALIRGSDMPTVTIGGSLRGGPLGRSGTVEDNGTVGSVKIGGDVTGGAGNSSGSVFATFLTSLSIGHSVIGGAGSYSGAVRANGLLGTPGDLGAVKIGGDVIGAGGAGSGSVTANGSVASVNIGGSVLGGLGDGTGQISGALTTIAATPPSVGPIKIGGDLRGSSVGGSDSIDSSGYIAGRRIASVTIGGSIISGIDQSSGALTHNASIRAQDDLGAVVVKGSLIGNSSAMGNTPVIISARGQATPGATSDLAIASLTVGGRIERAYILGGFDPDDPNTAGSYGNASIGAVSVGGDWIASSISAGIQDEGPVPGFGDINDKVIDIPTDAATDAIIARIASIAIKGQVIGVFTPGAGEVFGFVAQEIGSFKSLGFTAPLTAATDGLIPLSPITSGVAIHEV